VEAEPTSPSASPEQVVDTTSAPRGGLGSYQRSVTRPPRWRPLSFLRRRIPSSPASNRRPLRKRPHAQMNVTITELVPRPQADLVPRGPRLSDLSGRAARRAHLRGPHQPAAIGALVLGPARRVHQHGNRRAIRCCSELRASQGEAARRSRPGSRGPCHSAPLLSLVPQRQPQCKGLLS
jgi:hypothetical protein